MLFKEQHLILKLSCLKFSNINSCFKIKLQFLASHQSSQKHSHRMINRWLYFMIQEKMRRVRIFAQNDSESSWNFRWRKPPWALWKNGKQKTRNDWLANLWENAYRRCNKWLRCKIPNIDRRSLYTKEFERAWRIKIWFGYFWSFIYIGSWTWRLICRYEAVNEWNCTYKSKLLILFILS